MIEGYQDKVEIVGKVVIPPKVVRGDPPGCLIRVQVLSGEVDCDFCDILIMKGHKPWLVKRGTIVRAVGGFVGNRFLAEGCWKFEPRRARW